MPTDVFGTYQTLIVNLGILLLNCEKDEDVHGKSLQSMMSKNTHICYDYETRSIPKETMGNAIQRLEPRIVLFELLAKLKVGRKLYAVANLSASSWALIKNQGGELWDIFDGVFVSGTYGACLPELTFFHRVLSETSITPKDTIFVDDTTESLVTARSLEFKTVVYNDPINLDRLLYNMCFDPVIRAHQYLAAHPKRHVSYTLSTGEPIHENFCQLLILEATGDTSLVEFTIHEAEFNFFRGLPKFTTSYYPNDLDTTSLAWIVCPELADSATKQRVMDRMLTFCDRDGIPLVYFDTTRPRRDLVIAANVVTLFYAEGRETDVQKAAKWIFTVLRTGAYMNGSRYYVGAEPFLYSISRLLEKGPSIDDDIRRTFKVKCRERIGTPGDTLALAMRLHCCNRAGLKNDIDLQRLLELQQRDGGWEAGCFYRYGTTDRRVGNRGLTTAIAQRAIREYRLKDCTDV